MKKFLLSLTLILGCIPIFAQAEETTQELYKAQFGKDYNKKGVSAYNANWTIECNGTTWDVSCFNNSNNAWAFVRAGSKKAASTAFIKNQDAFPEKITQVKIAAIKAANNYTVDSAKLVVSATTLTEDLTFDITSQVNALTMYSSADALTATPDIITVDIDTPVENGTYKLVFEMPKYSNNGFLQINSVSYVGVPAAGQLLDPNLKFLNDNYSVEIGRASCRERV